MLQRRPYVLPLVRSIGANIDGACMFFTFKPGIMIGASTSTRTLKREHVGEDQVNDGGIVVAQTNVTESHEHTM